MKREEYDEKMQALVSDVETYEQIARDQTKKTCESINKQIDEWANKGFIKQSEVKVYKLHNCNPPRMYGLPKTHKDGRPLRIINSTIGTATYKMARYLSNILNQVAVILKYVQAIFAHLGHSSLQYYTPRGLWGHFKLQGEPVNLREQQDAVEFFMSLFESLDEEGADAYHCDKCDKKVVTVKRLCVRKLPPVLAIQLKRFEYDYERGLDGETFFKFVFLAAIVMLLLVVGQAVPRFVWQAQAIVGGAQDRRTGNTNNKDVDYEWIPAKTLKKVQNSPKGAKCPPS
ncbi:hypothetical protein quinque_008724 [Culex quinquefasciatus]